MSRDSKDRPHYLLSDSVQGFTLMEVMLATIILAMVVSMVTISLSGSLKVVDATRDQGDIYYRAQVALQRISEDLESAVLTDDVDFIGADTDETSDQRRIIVRFVSMAHLVFDPDADQGGMGHISYALIPDPDNEEELVLLRSDLLATPQQKDTDEEFRDGFLLSDRLRSVQFSYFDASGEEFDSWDTRIDPQADDDENKLKRRLPAAVSCRLEFWLDHEKEETLTFGTSVKIPVGMIMAEAT